ncbi:hypothetical protein E2C01_054553 [Portunus trituberculatus]|uniref:Uncharacterized protein n=1 Tax=Portunus trituberculatus TaxID=210409 RepID=A0A5B7GSA5_PORTR|nr:hypothetical protein [Portunus trituberculatus]
MCWEEGGRRPSHSCGGSGGEDEGQHKTAWRGRRPCRQALSTASFPSVSPAYHVCTAVYHRRQNALRSSSESTHSEGRSEWEAREEAGREEHGEGEPAVHVRGSVCVVPSATSVGSSWPPRDSRRPPRPAACRCTGAR